MFLWSILRKPRTELIRQVFEMQTKFRMPNDWVAQILTDMEKCNLQMNFEQISNVSQHYFRKLVKEKINILTRDYINEHRGTKMSKISDFKLQDYLVSKNISLKEKKYIQM